MIHLEGQKRIVVTGVGIVGPLGCGLEEVWKRLLAGRSGIRNLPDDITEGTGVAVGGQVPSLEEDAIAGYDPERIISAKDRKKMDRFIEFALVAAHEALEQAGWHPTDVADQERTATIISSGVGGFGAIADAVRTTDARGPRRLSPFTVPSFLISARAEPMCVPNGIARKGAVPCICSTLVSQSCPG
ncbi:hypothetical protein JFT98_06605 [Erwinia sp. TH29]|nr:hypothetical protein [Bacillus sp. TH86]MBK5315104.1 hypothetical protein [Erwinia sp. TH79]MBK5320605.1 hypothetical protein [Bacillus sp. TH59]MBK5335555.1 hypothetical protein [Bacillus sp. TH57]MBK5419964.1 hypothetical protein [Erwinia sp. TH29]